MGVTVREKEPGSGEWWVFINHQGKRKAKKIGINKNLALEVAKKIEAKLTLGDVGLPDKEEKMPSFKEYSEKWLNGYIKVLRRDTTHERYQHVLTHHILPTMGKIPIDAITRKDVRDLLLALHGRGLSKSSICLARDVLSGVFNHAIDDEMLEVNPVVGVVKRLQLTRDKKEEVEALTHEEVQLFLETCKEKRPDYHAFFLMLFRTGMRLGEALAIQWGDIDWNGKFVKVSKSYKRLRITKTKTGKSRRVDMSDQLIETLRRHHVEEKKKALQDGKGASLSYLFHDKEGKPLSQNTVRNVFKGILDKAGLRDIRIHDTRHSFASLLLSDGESPVYVKEQLGHSSIQMTVDIYGHLIPSSNREAVNKLDAQPAPATYLQPAKKEKA